MNPESRARFLLHIRQQAGDLLYERDPDSKLSGARALFSSCKAQVRENNFRDGKGQTVDVFRCPPLADIQKTVNPGRPERPELVAAGQVARRRSGSVQGRIALVHAIAHIEFNAVNLALDAVYRFDDMPMAFYLDWVRVAAEEASHFGMLAGRLAALGSFYGACTAHNGLWDMAVQTDHDVMVRMALVPRVLEARGLDITPAMIAQLERAGDHETVDILKVILAEEIGHVEIGSRWFHHCCARRHLKADDVFLELLATYMHAPPKTPFNVEARLEAGFSQGELTALEELEKKWLAELKAGKNRK